MVKVVCGQKSVERTVALLQSHTCLALPAADAIVKNDIARVYDKIEEGAGAQSMSRTSVTP